MLRATTAILAMLLVLPVAAESAEERAVGADSRKSLGLVVYSGGFAMVRDRREVELAEGRNRIALEDVSRQMDQSTAIVRAGDASVLAQTFDFDLLTQDRLLRSSLGREVGIVTTHPQTGEETVRRARVLSVDGGLVLELDGRIETGLPGRLVFDSLPEGVRPSPALVTDLLATKAAKTPLELAYLTGGLDWRADYVAEISPEGDSITLESWATLTNNTDTDFTDAAVSLVSGDINRRQAPRPKTAPMMMRSEAVALDSAGGAPMPEREGLGDYHLYRLGGQVTLARQASRKIALFDPARVASTRSYIFSNGQHLYAGRAGETRQNASIEIAFENAKADGLGKPLPSGSVRMFQRDAQGELVFIGEDSISRVPENQTVELNIGRAFDVTAERRQTSYDRRKDSLGQVTTTEQEMVLSNARDTAVTVKVRERLFGDWEILSESAGHEKLDAFQVEWEITVPAGGETVLTWKARVRT